MKTFVLFGCAWVLLAAAIVSSAPVQAQESASPAAAPSGSTRGGAATAPAQGSTRGSASGGRGAGATLGGGGRSGPVGGFGGGAGAGLGGGLRGSTFGGGGRGSGGSGVAAPSAVTDGPTSAVDATIYEVRLPLDQIGKMDIDALTKAAGTPADFEKALAALGTIQPLYHVNQSVRIGGDHIQIGTQTPYITNSQITNTGQIINSVAYTQVGAIFSVAGSAIAGGNFNLDLAMQVSIKSEGSTPISNKVNAPNFRTASLSRKGAVQPGQPFVVLSVDAGSLDADSKAVACVARVIFGPAQGD